MKRSFARRAGGLPSASLLAIVLTFVLTLLAACAPASVPARTNASQPTASAAAVAAESEQLQTTLAANATPTPTTAPASPLAAIFASPTETPVPPQQEIMIESPVAGAALPNPFPLIGRVSLTPVDRALSYRVRDFSGAVIGNGTLIVQGEPGEVGVFSTTVAYSTPLPGGVQVEVIAPDGSTSLEAQVPALTANLPQGISLSLNGVATRARGEIVPRVRNTRYPIDLNGAPEHLRVLFDDDQLSETFDPRERQLLVLPVDDYRALFRGADLQLFNETIQSLQTLLINRPVTLESDPPLLPASGLTPALRAPLRYIDFKDGSGLRFITHLTQEIAPFTASSLLYTFQGLTQDGQYYIAAYVPISATLLPASPADVPAAQRDEFKRDYLAYVAGVAQTLEAQPDTLRPSLAALDAMMASLQIGDVLGKRSRASSAGRANPNAITGAAVELLNIRSGPGTRFRAIGLLAAGETAELLGRNADGQWLRVRTGDGTLGWVNRNYIETALDTATLPLVE